MTSLLQKMYEVNKRQIAESRHASRKRPKYAYIYYKPDIIDELV